MRLRNSILCGDQRNETPPKYIHMLLHKQTSSRFAEYKSCPEVGVKVEAGDGVGDLALVTLQ